MASMLHVCHLNKKANVVLDALVIKAWDNFLALPANQESDPNGLLLFLRGRVEFFVARAQGQVIGLDERKVMGNDQSLGDIIEGLKDANALSNKDIKSNSLTMCIYAYERAVSMEIKDDDGIEYVSHKPLTQSPTKCKLSDGNLSYRPSKKPAYDWFKHAQMNNGPQGGYIRKGMLKWVFQGCVRATDYIVLHSCHWSSSSVIRDIDNRKSLLDEFHLLHQVQVLSDAFLHQVKHYGLSIHQKTKFNSADTFIESGELDTRNLQFCLIMIAPKLEGTEKKFSGFDRAGINSEDELGLLMDAFAHCVATHTEKTMILVDLQGPLISDWLSNGIIIQPM
ncbi:hypothetical protein K439DRAFT_1614812 [Ramaria rubella]|nr:hypothetical protein K439DRAFT_1614812 [Ramaria rubella]